MTHAQGCHVAGMPRSDVKHEEQEIIEIRLALPKKLKAMATEAPAGMRKVAPPIASPAAAPAAGGQAGAAHAKAPSAPIALLRLLASVQAHARGQDSATALATELAVAFACDRVSIGTVSRGGMRLVALSHQSLGREKAALLQLITAAMDEAHFQTASLVVPVGDSSDRHILLAHRVLSARLHNECVLTVPMACGGSVHGAITLERPASHPFDARERQFLEHVAALVGPVLELKLARDLPWWQWLWRRLRKRMDTFNTRSAKARAVVAGAVLLLAAVAYAPVPYRASASAHLEGTMQRALAAPADGFIKSAQARPGDEVTRGQVLAELNDEEFRLERDRRQSELVQLQSALGDALAKHDYAQIGVLSAKAQAARADVDLAEQQLQRTRLEAPFDGVVIKGDLSQSIGAPVRQGDTLFVLSPAQGHRIILDVDEKDIADVDLGQHGRLTLSAYPGQSIPFTVKRITPLAVARDGRNFFEVEAATEEASTHLRPGLQGVAKIDVDRRALAWVLGHDLWHWVRLTLWRVFG